MLLHWMHITRLSVNSSEERYSPQLKIIENGLQTWTFRFQPTWSYFPVEQLLSTLLHVAIVLHPKYLLLEFPKCTWLDFEKIPSWDSHASKSAFLQIAATAQAFGRSTNYWKVRGLQQLQLLTKSIMSLPAPPDSLRLYSIPIVFSRPWHRSSWRIPFISVLVKDQLILSQTDGSQYIYLQR